MYYGHWNGQTVGQWWGRVALKRLIYRARSVITTSVEYVSRLW